MTKELRRLSIIVLVMFLALFISTTTIQGFQSDSLQAHPNNTRAKYDSYEVQRGSIIASGSAIATSVPSDDVYSFRRVYNDPELWAPVTGYYNASLASSTGLENALNEELSGTSESQFFSRLDQLLSGKAPSGASVQISLNAKVQRAAFEALGDLQGAVVALEPKTGRILAMVSTPSYDTNTLATNDPSATNTAYDSLVAQPSNPLYNRAIGGNLNPPGSTFKLVVAAAALSSGKYTATSALPNPASYTLPQSSSKVLNASGGSCGSGQTVTIAEALRLSCNVPFAELAVQLGDDAIREAAEKFGFNTELSIPLKTTPSVYPRVLDAPQTALSGFGQSDVRATPLQIALVTAAIANKGVIMNPTIVDQTFAADFSLLSETEPTVFQEALSPEVADQLLKMMVNNVSSGVANGARIENVDVAGKTGTAENGSLPYSLWFTGFAPADDPQVVVAVVVEDGGGMGKTGSGNAIAAPIAKKVIEAVLNK